MMFYTYMHRRNDSGAVFYVGKGSGNRAHDFNGRSVRWKRVHHKCGTTVEIVAHWKDEATAFQHEDLLILCMLDLKQPLVNHVLTGKGISNYIRSDALKRTSQALATAAKQTASVRLKMSAAAIAKYKREGVRSELSFAVKTAMQRPEVRIKYEQNLEAAREKHIINLRAARSKKFICNESGLEFAILADAAKWLRANGKPKATEACVHAALTGIQKSAYGFHWSYTESK